MRIVVVITVTPKITWVLVFFPPFSFATGNSAKTEAKATIIIIY